MVLAVGPRGGLVVAGARAQAAMQVADEAVAEGPQRLAMAIPRRPALMVEGAAARDPKQRAQRPLAPRTAHRKNLREPGLKSCSALFSKGLTHQSPGCNMTVRTTRNNTSRSNDNHNLQG